jgi:Domain of unknown function (DUF3597)
MGFFSKILNKLGIGKDETVSPTHTAPGANTAAAAPTPQPGAGSGGSTGVVSSAAPTPKAMPVVDVVAQLEERAASNPQKLNWRTSIVDLLKLLDIDSSLGARKELATELGCPGNLMGDSAQMNMWLHKAVLARIAANGGNVPKELLD